MIKRRQAQPLNAMKKRVITNEYLSESNESRDKGKRNDGRSA